MLAVVERSNRTFGRPYVVRPKRLPPDVEELPEMVGGRDRRLDMDDAVGCMCVEPVEARTCPDERALGSWLGRWICNSHGGRHLLGDSVHENGEVDVDVRRDLLAT